MSRFLLLPPPNLVDACVEMLLCNVSEELFLRHIYLHRSFNSKLRTSVKHTELQRCRVPASCLTFLNISSKAPMKACSLFAAEYAWRGMGPPTACISYLEPDAAGHC